MRRDGARAGDVRAGDVGSGDGSVMVEMLVALTCTCLLAGAVLSLLADAARVCQERRGRIEARALARAAADLYARDLARAGHGLAGARSVGEGGEAVPVLQWGEEGLAVTYATAPTVAVLDEGNGYYGLAGSARGAGIAPGAVVVGLGDAAVPPLGTVLEVLRGDGGDRLRLDWSGVVAATVRAIVVVERRELGLVPNGDLWQLRQRAVGGNWQPSVDGLAQVQVRFAADGDGDGRPDAWETTPGPGEIPAAHVRVVARLASGITEVAESWVRR